MVGHFFGIYIAIGAPHSLQVNPMLQFFSCFIFVFSMLTSCLDICYLYHTFHIYEFIVCGERVDDDEVEATGANSS